MSDLAIRAVNLGKRYRLGEYIDSYRTLRDFIIEGVGKPLRWMKGRSEKKPADESIWALREVSFELRRGQVLGVIGRNGAGKSTLLKLLSRVTEPTEGYAEVFGRVGSLLEVGTGFHPELTGRENIFLNGAILGMKRTEIIRRFDEIVDFAEVPKFIDTPVKRYSSGMYLRLAFAVAAHLEPEILVVDEVLAVGDAEFQKKCLGKMGEVAEQGRTILFVSHNMSAIARLTAETIVLEDGRIALSAPTNEAIDYYLSANLSQAGEIHWSDVDAQGASGPFHPRALRVIDHHGRISDKILSTKPFLVEFEYQLDQAITGLRTGLYISTTQGDPVFTTFDLDAPEDFESHAVRPEGIHVSRCTFPANMFNEGRFVLGVNASSFRIQSYYTNEQALSFMVDGTGAPGSHWPERRTGPLRPALDWEIVELKK
ncbi:MAG: ABC transporter ATP-binding protein [Chloroflexi bacterium]|nr:ABC transporter ATP-binding protein [Chloroflexota bacterium]